MDGLETELCQVKTPCKTVAGRKTSQFYLQCSLLFDQQATTAADVLCLDLDRKGYITVRLPCQEIFTVVAYYFLSFSRALFPDFLA